MASAHRLPATVGAITLTGQPANLIYASHANAVMIAIPGQLFVNGMEANLQTGGGEIDLTPQPGVINFGRRKRYLLGPWQLR